MIDKERIRAVRQCVRRRQRVIHHVEHMLTMVVGGSVCFGIHTAEAIASGGIAVLMIVVFIAGEET